VLEGCPLVRVKVCGITNLTDAMIAAELGAHGLGFIFAPSPRRVSPEAAQNIIKRLPPFVQAVGVFVNENPGRIKEIMDYCGLDLVQLHGEESPDMCKALMPRCIKAIRIGTKVNLKLLQGYEGKVRALLLDTHFHKIRGGTGEVFDWRLAAHAKGAGLPIILAGGLNPGNVKEAVEKVKPMGVDVNSGVEQRPGKKSPMLLEEFMNKIREINHEDQTYG